MTAPWLVLARLLSEEVNENENEGGDRNPGHGHCHDLGLASEMESAGEARAEVMVSGA